MLLDIKDLREEVEQLKAQIAALKPKRGRPRKTDESN